MKRDIRALLDEHEFFAGMQPEWLDFIAGCATNTSFEAGQYVGRAGHETLAFYALRHGRVALEIHAPGAGTLPIATVQGGEILGWSWLFPPHQWDIDARATEPTRAIAFDCRCLRDKCDEDKEMGYDFVKRMARVFVKRLEATRLQLLDVYGSQPSR